MAPDTLDICRQFSYTRVNKKKFPLSTDCDIDKIKSSFLILPRDVKTSITMKPLLHNCKHDYIIAVKEFPSHREKVLLTIIDCNDEAKKKPQS